MGGGCLCVCVCGGIIYFPIHVAGSDHLGVHILNLNIFVWCFQKNDSLGGGGGGGGGVGV